MISKSRAEMNGQNAATGSGLKIMGKMGPGYSGNHFTVEIQSGF
jgi:hypothetical protein